MYWYFITHAVITWFAFNLQIHFHALSKVYLLTAVETGPLTSSHFSAFSTAAAAVGKL